MHTKPISIYIQSSLQKKLFTSGAPMPPIQYWTKQLIYTPDQWYSDVPDTFAIMKRQVSDIFFDLDKMVDEHVYCAGGPDFDPKTLTVEYLTGVQVGFTLEQADQIIKEEDCLSRFPNYIVMLDKQLNITWTMAGASEFLPKRKLGHNGISIRQKTMEQTSFFAFVVRNLSNNLCYYLKIGHFIPWERTWKAVNAAIYPACEALSIDVYREVNSPKDYSLCQYYPKKKGESTCYDNKEVTDYNFMPFRLRFRGRCIMAQMFHGERKTPILSLNVSDCINYNRNYNMEKYHDRQLFSFYPLVTRPQHISVYDNFHFKRHCLTAVVPNGQTKVRRIRVDMQKCVYRRDRAAELNSQLFGVVNPVSSETSFKFNKNMRDQVEDTSLYGKDHHLGIISYAKFRWLSPWKVLFCLYVQSTDLSVGETMDIHPTGVASGLVLIPCSDSFSSNSTAVTTAPAPAPAPASPSTSSSSFFSSKEAAEEFFPNSDGKKKEGQGHVFMLERSLVNGETYKSGITIGQYPASI